MSDKIRDLTPVDVTFAPGERPTDLKLEGMMAQVQEGLEFLENALGDAFGTGLQQENVWISNFARDIGNRDLLSPILLPNIFIDNYEQSLTQGENEHELDLIPVGSGGAVLSLSGDPSVLAGGYKATVAELEEEGDWTILPGKIEGGVEKGSRKLVTHSPAGASATVTFVQVTSGRGSAFVGAGLNVIPCAAQAENGGPFCSVALNDSVNNIYTFTLPIENAVTNHVYDIAGSSLSNTEASVGSGQELELPPYMFNASGLDMGATDGGTGQGKFFPNNMIRIYDWEEKKIVDGLLTVQASSSIANRTTEVICQFRSDISINEVSGKYLVVTSGATLSDVVGALQREMFFHTHSGDDMLRAITHSDLIMLRTGSASVNRSEYYGPSNIHNNDHSMYFHRDGFTDTDIGSGANVIRGDVVVGNTDLGDAADHEHHNLDADSYGLYFGSTASAASSIYFDLERTHNIPVGFGTLPASFTDTALVISGALDNGTQLLRTVYVEGNLRVENDVVLGTTASSNVIITGNLQSSNLSLTPALFQNTSTQITFSDLDITAALIDSSSARAHFNITQLADGSVSEPALGFQADTNTGLYRNGDDDISFGTGGTQAFQMVNSYVASHRRHRFEDGTEALPGMAFNNDPDTGFSRPADGSITVSSQGVQHSRFDANGLLYTTATAARYSDLAERYESDVVLQPGYVVKLGGAKEITVTSSVHDEPFGVISTEPAVMMNSEAGPDKTHPFVALVGRVPCYVKGPVKKFQKLITSYHPGIAEGWSPASSIGGNVIGTALQEKTDKGIGLIEITLGR